MKGMKLKVLSGRKLLVLLFELRLLTAPSYGSFPYFFFFFLVALQPQFGPWPTSMKLRFTSVY
jgi:hypothetical protein